MEANSREHPSTEDMKALEALKRKAAELRNESMQLAAAMKKAIAEAKALNERSQSREKFV